MINFRSHKKYLAIFTIAHLLGMLAVGLIQYLIDTDLGTSLNTGILVAAIFASTMSFVQDNGRAPEKKERRQLTIGFILITYVIALIIIALLVGVYPSVYPELTEAVKNKGMIILGPIGLLILGLFYYLIIGFCIAMFAKIAVKKLPQKS